MKYSDEEIHDKIKKVIFSCETSDHFKVATNMVVRFGKVVSKKNDALPLILEEILSHRIWTILGERVKEK